MKQFIEDRTMVEPFTGCWLWTSYVTPGGYGRTKAKGKSVLVHRLSYETYVGSIPEGLCIDHLCRQRSCVNPDHLEAVTWRENILRGEGLAAQEARRALCPRGHEYTTRKRGRYCNPCRTLRYHGRI